MKKLSQHVTFKSLAGIISLLVVFSAIVLIIGYNIFTEALLQQYSDGAYLTAKTASSFVNPDDMTDYVNSGGKGKKYTEVWKELDSICNSSGSTFVYVIIPDTKDYEHIKFIFSTINHNSPYTIYDFGYVRETTNDEYKVKYKSLYNKTSEHEMLIRDKGYIETDSHITMMVPLVGKDGDVKGILCVQRQMDILSNMRNSFISKVVFALLILVLIVIVVQSLFLHHTLLKPLKMISEEAARFSIDSTVAEKKLTDSIRNKDEIGALAGSIDHMEEQIYAYIENITNITAEKQRILTELNLATRIQAAMLPNVFPAFPERADFDIYASMDPAKEVGGDFYDYFLVDDDHLCIVMADVSGKGVPAALFMMASKIILANHAMLGKSPKDILTDTNNTICSNNREEMFVSVWLGILELSTGKLTASNAGHEYPVLCKPDGEFELFKDKHGFVIGGMDGMVYSEYEIDLKPGSKLFLYTDGVPEATNAEEELFGNERMVAALNKDASASSEEILGNVRSAVDEFVKNAEQFDDLTMLCIEYNGDKENEA